MPRDDADALRRRLYAPDASAADVARYEALATDRPASSSEPVPSDHAGAVSGATSWAVDVPARSSRRRRGPIVALVALAVVVAAVGVAALRIGEVQRLDGIEAPTVISSDGVDRQAFEQNLDVGNKAGIAAYLVTHRSPRAMAGATRYFTIERTGTGTVDLSLAPVPADADSGRATVLLVVGSDSVPAWTTYRRHVDSAGEQQWVRQTARGGAQSAGVLTATTFAYPSGERPVRLVVDVDAGVRWGVAVVFSD